MPPRRRVSRKKDVKRSSAPTREKPAFRAEEVRADQRMLTAHQMQVSALLACGATAGTREARIRSFAVSGTKGPPEPAGLLAA
jgi:hypothetical protein